jgi:hypothetical protein
VDYNNPISVIGEMTMAEKVLLQRISETSRTLFSAIKRLKKIGTELDVSRAQRWLSILKGNPSTEDLNSLWSEIQFIGSRMNYMDYTDNEFREAVSKLKNQMLDVIREARQHPSDQKDEPN